MNTILKSLYLICKALISSKTRRKLLDATKKDYILIHVLDYCELERKKRYIENWNIAYKRCPVCGELNPIGKSCAFCDYKKIKSHEV